MKNILRLFTSIVCAFAFKSMIRGPHYTTQSHGIYHRICQRTGNTDRRKGNQFLDFFAKWYSWWKRVPFMGIFLCSGFNNRDNISLETRENSARNVNVCCTFRAIWRQIVVMLLLLFLMTLWNYFAEINSRRLPFTCSDTHYFSLLEVYHS